MITIYRAKKIITMNPARPYATHVAVRDGIVLGAGDLDELVGWGEHTLDERFADEVLMPGFVEGHCHAVEGALWRYAYCGYFDRLGPDGTLHAGVGSIEALLARLREAEAALPNDNSPLSGWSLDPIYFDNATITREGLDGVSTTRPIGVLHASGHIMNVNSKALELAGLLRTGIEHPGMPLGADGLPTGELKGPDVLMPVGEYVGFGEAVMHADEPGLRDFAKLCVSAGVTTATDLAALLPDDAVEMMLRVTAEHDFPVRLVPMRSHVGIAPAVLLDRVEALAKRSTERLRFGGIKIHADGSIQGFSARLRAPGYYNGAPQGLWYVPPEHLGEILEGALARDVLVHVHTNGDEATDLVLDKLGAALRVAPARDHRMTFQHCQLADAAQFRRIAALGACVNLFANHHFYWGDQHYHLTVGPERATRMNACRTALDLGVPMAMHSDAPITPLAPLFTAWCAINRLTATGRTLGEHERIDVAEALRAITIGAAYTLKLDDEVGSIECGKRADFAILDRDPEAAGAAALKEVGVLGTVQGGRVFLAGNA